MELIPAKTLVTKNKSTSWFGAQYNMNIYRGCCHGCIYCDSRSECYGIEDFGRVRAKKDALRIIRDDLRRKVKTGIVATGSMSDPYNPHEKKHELTRHALELLSAYGFGVAVATKSDLVTRDIDILNEIKAHAPAIVKVTITAAHDELSRQVEPAAPPSSKRFEAIRELSQSGIFAGVLMMPLLPFLEDSEDNIRAIVHGAKQAGARFIYPSFGMTLRQGNREWFYQKLDQIYPGERIVEKYIRRYGNDYSCPSPKAKELWQVFARLCEEQGLLYKMPDIIAAAKLGYDTQLSFYP